MVVISSFIRVSIDEFIDKFKMYRRTFCEANSHRLHTEPAFLYYAILVPVKDSDGKCINSVIRIRFNDLLRKHFQEKPIREKMWNRKKAEHDVVLEKSGLD